MMLKKISKSSLLCFIAALLFAGAAISKTFFPSDSTLFMVALSWFSAVAFAFIGFREVARKTKS